MIDKKVYVIAPRMGVDWCFNEHGFEIVKNPDDADIIVWTGGEDINPALYGHSEHPTTWYSNRDNHEVEMYLRYVNTGKLLVGICRGHQLLSAMNGAVLFQDVDRHGGGSHGHDCKYLNAAGGIEQISVSSVHHQMVDPRTSSRPYEIWAWTNRSTYRDYETDERRPPDPELPDIEAIWWPETKCFGIQGHPEYSNKVCTEYFFCMLERAWSQM